MRAKCLGVSKWMTKWCVHDSSTWFRYIWSHVHKTSELPSRYPTSTPQCLHSLLPCHSLVRLQCNTPVPSKRILRIVYALFSMSTDHFSLKKVELDYQLVRFAMEKIRFGSKNAPYFFRSVKIISCLCRPPARAFSMQSVRSKGDDVISILGSNFKVKTKARCEIPFSESDL